MKIFPYTFHFLVETVVLLIYGGLQRDLFILGLL
jgi:hypothetical protein